MNIINTKLKDLREACINEGNMRISVVYDSNGYHIELLDKRVSINVDKSGIVQNIRDLGYTMMSADTFAENAEKNGTYDFSVDSERLRDSDIEFSKKIKEDVSESELPILKDFIKLLAGIYEREENDKSAVDSIANFVIENSLADDVSSESYIQLLESHVGASGDGFKSVLADWVMSLIISNIN